jgi:hypothetical protein
VYEALAEAAIPGPHAENARAARQNAAESTEKTEQAFQSAASALRAVRSRGDASDRLRAAAERIDRLGGVEPEPQPGEEPMNDEADAGMMPEDDSMAASFEGMTFEEILATLPEETRAMVEVQFQSQLDALNQIDDPEALRAALDAIDEQAAAMPAEFAVVIDYVRRQIQDRIDALESGGNP